MDKPVENHEKPVEKPPTQRVSVSGMDVFTSTGGVEPPTAEELASRNRMLVRVAGMAETTYLKRDGQVLTIDGEVTVPQLEALLFLMTSPQPWAPEKTERKPK